MRRELFGQKQRFVEAEESREVLRKELANIQRHYVELEDEQRIKECDYKLAVEEARRLKRKAIDERRNVELALDDANQMISELPKRDTQYKLGSIVLSLRRTIGYEPCNGSSTQIRNRSPSPNVRRRPISPRKGLDSNKNRAPHILDRTSRSPYHQFVQNFITTERERDDCAIEVTQLRRTTKELEENLQRTEQRFYKKSVDIRLQGAQSVMVLQEETIRQSERERKTMLDQISALERQLLAMENEKKQALEKMSVHKLTESHLSDDKRLLKRVLEGEIECLNMILTDKDMEIQQKREDKWQSLQLSVDCLSLTLAKAEEGESSLKTRVQSLNQTLSQSNYQTADLQQKLGSIQNASQSSESEQRVAQEKLEQAQ
ncbi:unnamed protein product [Rotaria sp. Silwood2]|nr:unnamed protein product [Rotaria sp. Silwood2]CAF4549595.1 unnamed protein product [Rotaria sp. Silwood2]